jgi:hypothetical protein
MKTKDGLSLAIVIIITYFGFAFQATNNNDEQQDKAIAKPVEQVTVDQPETEQVEEQPDNKEEGKVELTFEQVPVYRERIKGESLYVQIINRARRVILDSERSTNAHESVHMINNERRNDRMMRDGGKINAFFILPNKIFYAKEPSMSKAKVAAYIPSNLRGYRFKTYITGQAEWNGEPLYLVDEWSAYIASAAVILEDIRAKRYKEGNADGVSGVLEFSVYCTALCMAIEANDPSYFKENPEFLPFISSLLELSHKLYKEGQKYSEVNWFAEQKRILSQLRESKQAATMRAFMRKKLSGVWLDK